MLRLLPLVLVIVIAFFVVRFMAPAGSAAFERSRRSRRDRLPTGSRDRDRQSDQVRRQLRGVQGPPEQRDEIRRFIESHQGVEAYVEPKTMVSPMSVVLVDADGAWRRFELRGDRYLRQLQKTHRLRTFDASIVGYPPRIRRGQEPPAADSSG